MRASLCGRMRKKGKGSMFTTAISAIAIADIIVIVVLALGFLIGLIGGSKKAFKGIFATLGIIMLSLLIVSVSVNPIVGLAGGSLTSTFKEKAAGWGEVFTTEIYIAKSDDGAPLKDGDNYVYYINVVGEDGTSQQMMLEDATGKGLVDKAKAKLAEDILSMNSGVVPQQPPTALTPSSTALSVYSSNSSIPSLYTVRPPSRTGSPLFGWTITGSEVDLKSRSTIGRSSFGPREQFTPSASAPSPSITAAAISGVEPVSVRPVESKVTVAQTGFFVLSLSAKRQALSS